MPRILQEHQAIWVSYFMKKLSFSSSRSNVQAKSWCGSGLLRVRSNRLRVHDGEETLPWKEQKGDQGLNPVEISTNKIKTHPRGLVI